MALMTVLLLLGAQENTVRIGDFSRKWGTYITTIPVCVHRAITFNRKYTNLGNWISITEFGCIILPSRKLRPIMLWINSEIIKLKKKHFDGINITAEAALKDLLKAQNANCIPESEVEICFAFAASKIATNRKASIGLWDDVNKNVPTMFNCRGP